MDTNNSCDYCRGEGEVEVEEVLEGVNADGKHKIK